MKKILYLCDYCEKECDETEFIVPEWIEEDVKDIHGATITYFDKFIISHKHICKDCQYKIAAAIPFVMKYANVNFTDVRIKE